MNVGGVGYIFTVNGGSAGSTAETAILIRSFGGNDQIFVRQIDAGDAVTVQGGDGDDHYEVGTGRLSAQLNGYLFIEEVPGEGTDALVANDVLDDAMPDNPVRIRDNLLTSGTSSLIGVSYDGNVEEIRLQSSNAADIVYVESVPAGMRLSLGLGDDEVRFGAIGERRLPDFMAPGFVQGDGGVDRAIFDDDGQNDVGFLEYVIGPTRFLNQELQGVEHAELLVRSGGIDRNSVAFSGAGGVTETIAVHSVNLTTVRIGAPEARVDIDALDVTLDVSVDDVQIYDQDADASNHPFILYKAPGPRPLRLDKGGLHLLMGDVFHGDIRSLDIHGGSTNDVFAIGGLNDENVGIYGGAGDDLLHTNDMNGLDNDLDAIFAAASVYFNGGPGYDTLDLDDSNDETGDGDHTYVLGFLEGLTKGGRELIRFSGDSDDPDHTEHIRFVGDADSNTVHFGASFAYRRTIDYTLDGGPGNDLFTNVYPGSSGGHLFDNLPRATIVGGSGSDTIAIDDTLNVFSPVYVFHPDDRLVVADVTIDFDDSTETFTLEGSETDSQVRVHHKPPNATLVINGRGGDDAFLIGGGDIDNNGFNLSNTTITGGSGIDSIRFDDRLDDRLDGTTESETYLHTFSSGVNKLGKSTAGVNYSTFESLTIDAADQATGSFLFDNTFDLRTFSSLIESITVNGGTLRNSIVNLTTGNLDPLIGVDINLNFVGVGGDVLNLFDQGNTANRTHIFRAGQYLRDPGFGQTITVNHPGIETINLSAGSGSDWLGVEGIAAGSVLVAHGNNGDDRLNVDDFADWSAIDGPSFLYGDGGADLVVGIASGPLAGTARLSAADLSINGGPLQSYFGAESLSLSASFLGGTTLDVPSLAIPAQIATGNGNDSVTIGAGVLLGQITAPVTLSAGFGIDTVAIDDADSAGFSNYLLNASTIGGTTTFQRESNGPLITLQFAERVRLDGGAGDNNINVFATAADVTVNSGGGDDVVLVHDTIQPVTIDTGADGAFGDYLVVNSDAATSGDAPATARLRVSDRIATVEVLQNGKLQIDTAGTLDVAASLNLLGTLDLAGGALLSRAGVASPATLRTWLLRGRNGGAWNGAHPQGAINSSLAATSPALDGVGYGLGSQVLPTAVGGFALGPADTLVRHTLEGDANLDRVVDVADLGIVASNWQQTGRTFAQGDFNFDDVANVADLGALATNWQASLPAAPATLLDVAPAKPAESHPAPRAVRPLEGVLGRPLSVLGTRRGIRLLDA